MKRSVFVSFVIKEFYHIFRDKITMLIILGIPVVQIILFGFAITNDIKEIKFAAYSPVRDISVTRIIDRLNANECFSFVGMVDDHSQIETTLRKDDVEMILVFRSEFPKSLAEGDRPRVQLMANASDPNKSEMFTSYASGIINSEISRMRCDAVSSVGIMPVVKLMFNPGMKSAYNFVPGVMGLILMLICAMMTSLSIVKEKENGTMEVLLASPVSSATVILAKVVPYFTLSCINLLTILLLSRYVINVPIEGNMLLLVLVSMLYLILTLSLGIFISTIVKNQHEAMMITAMGLLLPVLVFSGMVFPIENMPPALQKMSVIMPARWYIAAVRKIMIEGLGTYYVTREILILSLMSVLLITGSILNYKNRL